jgi:hypothetical protein
MFALAPCMLNVVVVGCWLWRDNGLVWLLVDLYLCGLLALRMYFDQAVSCVVFFFAGWWLLDG